MKHDKRYPNSFLTRLVSLLVAEIFLCSSVLPVWALPTESLRPKVAAERLFAAEKEAADGGEKWIPGLYYGHGRMTSREIREAVASSRGREPLATYLPKTISFIQAYLKTHQASPYIPELSGLEERLIRDLMERTFVIQPRSRKGETPGVLIKKNASLFSFVEPSGDILIVEEVLEELVKHRFFGVLEPSLGHEVLTNYLISSVLLSYPDVDQRTFLRIRKRLSGEILSSILREAAEEYRMGGYKKLEYRGAHNVALILWGMPKRTPQESAFQERVHAFLSPFALENRYGVVLLKGGSQGGLHPAVKEKVFSRLSPYFEIVEGTVHGLSHESVFARWHDEIWKRLLDRKGIQRLPAFQELRVQRRYLAHPQMFQRLRGKLQRESRKLPEQERALAQNDLRRLDFILKFLQAEALPLLLRRKVPREVVVAGLGIAPDRLTSLLQGKNLLELFEQDFIKHVVVEVIREELFSDLSRPTHPLHDFLQKARVAGLTDQGYFLTLLSPLHSPFLLHHNESFLEASHLPENDLVRFKQFIESRGQGSAPDGGRSRDGGERNFAQERDLVTKIRRILTETPEKYQELTEEIEAVGPNAIYPLLFLLTDSNREVSEFAFAFIRDHQDLGAHPLVAAALRDEKDENRSRPASALVVLKSKATAPRVVEEALRDTDEKVRERAVRLILLMPEDASRPLVASALRHVEPEVRQRQEDLLFHPEMASHIIGHIASAFLHDPSAEVRERALEWLKRVPEEAASHLGYAAIYERQETRRHRAQEAIIHHFAKEGTQFLASFYVSRKHKHTGRGEERSLEILGQIWRSTPEAIRALRFHQSRGIRRFARAWLGDPPDPTRRSAGDGGQREAKDGGWIQGQLRKLVQSGEIQFLGGDDLTYQRTLEAFAELVLAFIKNPTSPSTDEMYRGFLAVANFVEGQFHIKIVFKKGRGLPKLTRLVREGRGEVKNSAPDGGRSRDGGEKLVSALLAGALVLPVSVPHASIPKPSPLQGLTRDPVLNYLDTVSQPGVHLIGRPFLSDDQIQTLSTAIADKEGLGKPADDPINQEYRKRIETLLREYGEVLREEEAALQEIASAIGRGEKVVLAVEGTGQTLQQLLIDAQEQYRVFSGWMQQRGFEDYRDKAKQLLLLMGGEPAYLWVTSQDVTLYPLADSALYEKGQSFLGRFKEAFEALAQTRRKKGVPDDLIGKWHTDTSQALGALGRDPTEEEIENFLRPLEDPAVKKEARQLILRTLPIYRTDREQQEMMGRRLRQLALTQGLQFRTTVFAIVTDKRREALAKFLKANNIKLASEAKDGGDIFHAHPFQETTRSLLIPTFSP